MTRLWRLVADVVLPPTADLGPPSWRRMYPRAAAGGTPPRWLLDAGVLP